MKIGNVVKIKIGVVFGYWYNLKYCYMDIIIMLIILNIKSWFMIWFKKNLYVLWDIWVLLIIFYIIIGLYFIKLLINYVCKFL